jgi:hypothetical protein
MTRSMYAFLIKHSRDVLYFHLDGANAATGQP